MRNAAAVILWVAAAACLFLSPAKAETESEEEIPPSTEQPLVNVESNPDHSTNRSIVLDQFSGSDVDPQIDVVPEADVVREMDVALHSEDEDEEEEDYYYMDEEVESEGSINYERGIGNIRSQRSDGQKKKVNNSQNPKGLRKRKGVDTGAKRQKGERRRPEDVKLKSRKKQKGEETKSGQKIIRNKKTLAEQMERIVKSKLSGKHDTRPSVKRGESSLRNESKRGKREA